MQRTGSACSLHLLGLVTIWVCASCDGQQTDLISSGTASGGASPSKLGTAKTVTLVGVTISPGFATTGELTIAFTALDASNQPLFATPMDSAPTKAEQGWLAQEAKPDAAIVVTAKGHACTQAGLDLQRPQAAAGKLAVTTLLDESGSMKDNDPSALRAEATRALLKVVCAAPTNLFGVFDFGACGQSTGGQVACQPGATATRDLLAADASKLTGPPPWVPCAQANLQVADQALAKYVQPVGDTPLFQSVLETCQQMAANRATGGVLAGPSLAMVVMSDGINFTNLKTERQAAEACIKANALRVCTVGLGEGSELSANPNPQAVADLRALATTGNCTYAAATNAQALQGVFNGLGVAVKDGHNRVRVVVKPIPVAGTAVSGQLKVGSAQADFSFVPL